MLNVRAKINAVEMARMAGDETIIAPNEFV